MNSHLIDKNINIHHQLNQNDQLDQFDDFIYHVLYRRMMLPEAKYS